MSFISSLEINNVVVPETNILLRIAASVADTAVNPDGIKTLLANGLITFPIKSNSVFSNGSNSLPKKSSLLSYFMQLGFW